MSARAIKLTSESTGTPSGDFLKQTTISELLELHRDVEQYTCIDRKQETSKKTQKTDKQVTGHSGLHALQQLTGRFKNRLSAPHKGLQVDGPEPTAVHLGHVSGTDDTPRPA